MLSLLDFIGPNFNISGLHSKNRRARGKVGAERRVAKKRRNVMKARRARR